MMRPDETSHEKLQTAVAQIRRRFLDEMEERILDIEALKQMVAKGDRGREALAAIIHRAHKIRGVAGTLGLDTLGDAAARLEDRYHQLFQTADSQTIPFTEGWSMIASLVETLLDEMERALEN